MHRSLAIFLAGGLFLIGSLGLAIGASAATIAPTTTCSNGVDNTGGLGLICNVTVHNTITAGGGTAVVTVQECHGAAGDPSAACTNTTTSLTGPVTVVNQCNDSINGGGGTLRCSVQITNDFVGVSPGATGVTVNQCVGSGGGITTGCSPFPATTSGAAITQCNGSANGGTLVGLTCTATGTMATAAGVTINQCNGSANGGGSLVICSATITNNASVSPTPSASATASASTAASIAPSTAPTAAPVTQPTVGPNLTVPPTDSELAADPGARASSLLPLLAILLLAFVGLVVGVVARHIRVR
jgi:hypothetical protein